MIASLATLAIGPQAGAACLSRDPPEPGQELLTSLPLPLLPAGHWWGASLLQGELRMVGEVLMLLSASWWLSQCRSGGPRLGARTGSCIANRKAHQRFKAMQVYDVFTTPSLFRESTSMCETASMHVLTAFPPVVSEEQVQALIGKQEAGA
jgi:hypothetical protein